MLTAACDGCGDNLPTITATSYDGPIVEVNLKTSPHTDSIGLRRVFVVCPHCRRLLGAETRLKEMIRWAVMNSAGPKI